MPSQVTGATAGAARRFAGSATSDTVPKTAAPTGAVPSVAAQVTAPASATARGTPRRTSTPLIRAASTVIAVTAAKLSCQPGSSRAAGSSASVTAAASSSACQRAAGRDASVATTAAAPITPARWIDAPEPATGTYRAISARTAVSRSLRPSPSHDAAPSASTDSSAMLAPLAATRCPRPARRSSSRSADRHGRVVTQHHAAQQRPPAGPGHPALERPLRARAHAVDERRGAAPARAVPAHLVRLEDRVDVPRAQPPVARAERTQPA